MANIQLYSQDGKAKQSIEVSDAIFNVPVKVPLLHQAVRTAQANRRVPLAHTKTRGEVSGGGKKPWKQKGTGRARHGSIRSPLWVGGGVTFGPTPDRNFSLRFSKRSKKLAMRMALSSKVSDGSLFAIDALTIAEPKTKLLSSLVKTWPAKGEILLVVDAKNENVEVAAKNIPSVWVARAEAISVEDVLKARRVAVLEGALPKLEKLFAPRAA